MAATGAFCENIGICPLPLTVQAAGTVTFSRKNGKLMSVPQISGLLPAANQNTAGRRGSGQDTTVIYGTEYELCEKRAHATGRYAPNNEMAWFKKEQNGDARKVKIPEGLWIKCDACREIVYRREVERNLMVCPKCNYHFRIAARQRIELTFDRFQETEPGIEPRDPLGFSDTRPYTERLRDVQAKTGQTDAVVTGVAGIAEISLVAAVMDFHFMGGSMGSVVGEKIARAAELATGERLAFCTIASSGGARMQEGILSLMQMAKTSAAIGAHKDARPPFISVLTDPTFGGVTASFAMLGDVILAEPKSLIGFAGPRVIEQTIRQELPEGFQRAEFLLEHGMIDRIVERRRLKETLAALVRLLT